MPAKGRRAGLAGLVHCLLLSGLKDTICTNVHGGCGERCIKFLCCDQGVDVCLQLHDLVRTFPRFSFETASDAGTVASQPDTPKRPPQPSTPAAHTASSQAPQSAAAAAAAMARAAASAGSQQEQQEHTLQQLIASIAAAAAAAAAKAPAATAASPASAGGSTQSSPRVPPLGEPSTAAAAAAGGAAAASRCSPRLQGQPMQQQPWVNPLYGVSRKPSPEREPREAREGRQGAISPARGSSRQQQMPTSPGSVTGARAVPPPQKMLTPDESAKLMGFYK
jgi:hypothetical protein